MSYLPRMSNTYKEPKALEEEEEREEEEPKELTSSLSIKPASALLNEKTNNPQIALKHYRYVPHPPPVLPGPSVLDEAVENELFREASRMRRSSSKMEPLSMGSQIVEVTPETETSTVQEKESTENVKRTTSRKGTKASKSSLGRKRSSKAVKKENSSNVTVNMCLTSEKPFTAAAERGFRDFSMGSEFLSKHEIDSLKREKTICPLSSDDLYTKEERQAKTETKNEKPEVQEREFTNRSVQCTIFGSFSKVFVIPPIINSLLRTLAFLLNEINKEEAFAGSLGEKKFPMTQIQLLLGDLCNQKVEKDYCFDVTYSDSKRLEKILGEFQKYMKDVYGDKGEYIDKMEDLKRVFIESKSKEMELAILNEKLHDREAREGDDEVVVKEEDLRNPEITLQNKRLESEQLTAEVEFSCRELKKYQKTIAEIDWEIRNFQEQIASLKKSNSSKAKTETKSSAHKFSGELLAKSSRSKDSDSSFRRKA